VESGLAVAPLLNPSLCFLLPSLSLPKALEREWDGVSNTDPVDPVSSSASEEDGASRLQN